MPENYYQPLSAVSTGIAGKCPRCGHGKLFSGYLSVAKACTSCGLDFGFADAGDGATWFVMLFACVVGVGSIVGIEIAYSPVWWIHVLIAIPLLIVLPVLLLRPVKGMLLCQQWKTGASEGRTKP
jgi:uncharacterized protein (DUF983 family)